MIDDFQIVQTLSAQLSWSHNTLLFDKTKTLAEYAIKDINKPIGVSEYKLSDFVPQELADTLPSVEDIEKRIKRKYAIEE